MHCCSWSACWFYVLIQRKLMAFRLEHLLGKAAVVENAGALQDGLRRKAKWKESKGAGGAGIGGYHSTIRLWLLVKIIQNDQKLSIGWPFYARYIYVLFMIKSQCCIVDAGCICWFWITLLLSNWSEQDWQGCVLVGCVCAVHLRKSNQTPWSQWTSNADVSYTKKQEIHLEHHCLGWRPKIIAKHTFSALKFVGFRP